MENMELKTEKTSSIAVSRTSKGAYSWDLKLYFDAQQMTGDAIIIELKRLDELMKTQFRGAE